MTDTRWTTEDRLRWKRNRSPQRLARDKGETKQRRRRARRRLLAKIAVRKRCAASPAKVIAPTVPVSAANHLAFTRGFTKRQARLELEAALRKRLGYS